MEVNTTERNGYEEICDFMVIVWRTSLLYGDVILMVYLRLSGQFKEIIIYT